VDKSVDNPVDNFYYFVDNFILISYHINPVDN